MLKENILFERVQPDVGRKVLAVEIMEIPGLEVLWLSERCAVFADDFQMPEFVGLEHAAGDAVGVISDRHLQLRLREFTIVLVDAPLKKLRGEFLSMAVILTDGKESAVRVGYAAGQSKIDRRKECGLAEAVGARQTKDAFVELNIDYGLRRIEGEVRQNQAANLRQIQPGS